MSSVGASRPERLAPYERDSPYLPRAIGPMFDGCAGDLWVLALRISPEHVNARGQVHRGLPSTTSDVGLGNAVARADDRAHPITVSLTVAHLAPCAETSGPSSHARERPQAARRDSGTATMSATCWSASLSRRLNGMPFRVLHAADMFWRPSNQMGVLNIDLGKQLETDTLGARLWRLKPGQASTRHRHVDQTELYVVIEGTGRARIEDELLTLAPLSAMLADLYPDGPKALPPELADRPPQPEEQRRAG